jgi:hypothetical protein
MFDLSLFSLSRGEREFFLAAHLSPGLRGGAPRRWGCAENNAKHWLRPGAVAKYNTVILRRPLGKTFPHQIILIYLLFVVKFS